MNTMLFNDMHKQLVDIAGRLMSFEMTYSLNATLPQIHYELKMIENKKDNDGFPLILWDNTLKLYNTKVREFRKYIKDKRGF